MNWQETDYCLIARGAQYDARVFRDGHPRVRFDFDGQKVAALPLAAALDKIDEKEKLSNVRVVSFGEEDGFLTLVARADSNLWADRRFLWRFGPRYATFRHCAAGEGRLGRCFFFATGRPVMYEKGDSDGYRTNATFYVPRYRTMSPNLANLVEFDISMPGFAGIGSSENIQPGDYCAMERHNGLFRPAPLFYAFFRGATTMGIGLGCRPGAYRFNGLEYTGSMKHGAALYVQYCGYTQTGGEFASPEIQLSFGYDPFDCLRQHIDWIDEAGYGTAFRFPNEEWHRAPVFCGWAEQTATLPEGMQAAEACTQANYERWIAEAERRGIPFGTVVIDDKWQKEYGCWVVDTAKWPDMPGFVRAQHAKGRHVLLWIPAYQSEGLPERWLARDASGKAVFADPANEEYARFVREGVTKLLRETDADGFKEDWFGRSAMGPGYGNYGALHGLEMVRRFQFLVHDAAHAVKRGALVQTQTPNPLFRESSDMLRLNDIWFATRELPEMMRERARTARIAGWQVLDCDNASSTTIDEWFAYAQAQPRFGVPSLYFLSETESTHDAMTNAHSDYLSALWRDYNRENGT